MAIPRRVLMRLTASAPCCSAAAATSAGEAQLGVSLTINGFSEIGRTTSSSAASSLGSAPMTSPVLTFGHETLSSIAETSSRSLKAATRRATSSRVEPMTLTISGTGSSASCGRSSLEVAVEPLVGQPDRVDHAAGQLPQPRRRVALARLERDGLGDEGGEREVLVEGVAERLAGGDRVEGPGAVDDPVGERDAAELDQSSSIRSPGRRRRGGRNRAGWGRRSRSRRRSRRPCPTPWRAGRARPRSLQIAATASSIGGGPQA